MVSTNANFVKFIIWRQPNPIELQKIFAVIKVKGPTLMRCLQSTAPMTSGYCHSEYIYSACIFHPSSVDCGNSVGDYLFQSTSKVDVIIESTVECAIL